MTTKPDIKKIIEEAKKLRDNRFKQRDQQHKDKEDLRYRRKIPVIPEAYRDTASVYLSPVADEEGKQVTAILEAKAQPHVIPPDDTMQPQSTLMEQWLAAGDIELDCYYGNCSQLAGDDQIHRGIGWLYEAPKRKPYPDAPKAPTDEGSMDLLSFDMDLREYKKSEGISGWIERRWVPANTAYFLGQVRNPLKFYEVKEVDETELLLTYGITKDRNGAYSKPADGGTAPAGQPEYGASSNQGVKIKIIEYWDRDWMFIVCESQQSYGNKSTPFELDSWEHNFGRVPYYAEPAFERASLDEHTRFVGPLDAVYAEIEAFNELMTMKRNVTYLRSYPSWQIVTKEQGDQILDDTGNPKTYVKFKPGEMFQGAPGQEVLGLPMQAGNDLVQEVALADARIKQFSLSDVSKGVSPGADTANSAISQLRRLQRSSLERMAQNRALMYREIYKQRLARLKEYGEPVYVMNALAGKAQPYGPVEGLLAKASEQIGLDPQDVVTLNLHVKYEPDTGQDLLIEEKQAADLVSMGLITKQEFHERRGKENPEQYVIAGIMEQVRTELLPTLMQQILANLGDSGAIAKLIAANQQTGSAQSAVDGIFGQMQQGQNPTNGLGVGSPGMPRGAPVREPAIATNTRPDMVQGLVREERARGGGY